MPFTDDDLALLKDRLVRMPNIDVCNCFGDDKEILALIARLEAAEDALSSATQGAVFIHNKDMERWRKAAGRD